MEAIEGSDRSFEEIMQFLQEDEPEDGAETVES
jgi:hypothetical protein